MNTVYYIMQYFCVCKQFINTKYTVVFQPFLTRDAVVRRNHRAIVMMFVRLSVWDGRALWSYGAR